MVTWTRRAVLAGGLGGAFVAAAGASASDGPLRIGILEANLGAEYRAEAINSEGGHVIELIAPPASADMRDATAALLERGVHALIGPASPWLSDAVAEIANAACTPLVCPAPSNSLPYVFAAGPTPAQSLNAMARAIRPRKAGWLALDKLSTPDGAAPVEEFPLGANDLTAPIKALAAQRPDVMAVWAPPPYDAFALRDARAAGWAGPILLPPTAANPGVAAPAAEGARMVAPWLAAAKQAPDSLPQTPTLRRFVAGFESPLSTQNAAGADAVTLLHLAFLGHRDRRMARDQLDQLCAIGACGIYDHGKLSDDALIPMTMTSGVWTAEKST